MNDRVQARLETGRAIQTHSVIPVAPLLQQKCASNECVQRHGRFLQTNVIGSMESTVPASAPQALQSEGQPLDAGIRGRMESRFGHDFGQVRVHADAAAAESAWSVDALAYTLGTDVVFARGQYAPHTAAGQKILAHELAQDRKSTRLNSRHLVISYAVFCLKKKHIWSLPCRRLPRRKRISQCSARWEGGSCCSGAHRA